MSSSSLCSVALSHEIIELQVRVPVLGRRIDRAPPMRTVPKPSGSKFRVGPTGVVVTKFGPTGRTDMVVRSWIPHEITTYWADVYHSRHFLLKYSILST